MAILKFNEDYLRHLSPLTSIGILLASGAFYVVWRIVYNVYFHPLSNFPGPWWSAACQIPAVRDVLRGRMMFCVSDMHAKYGPVVRISPSELSFATAQAWRDIYAHRQNHENFHKSPIHVGSVQALPGASTLTMADDENHSRQRRALSHAFSQKALVEQEHIIGGYVDLLCTRLGETVDKNEAANIVAWYNYCTFDIIGDMSFGEPFGCLENGEYHFWVSLIFQTVKAGALEQCTRRLAGTDTWAQKMLMKIVPDRIKEQRKEHLQFSREKVMKRMELGLRTEHRDFLWYILRQAEKGSVSENEIIVNAALFIVAGSETTASFLSSVTSHLLRAPDKFKVLIDEIRNTFQSEDELQFDSLLKLPYLNAVINEGLRIFPPVPTGLARTVPKGGDTVDGYAIPEGTTVSVYAWAATHMEFNFKRPTEFIPERWLPDNKEFATDNLDASVPFSTGPRGCIGKHLSYVEMRLILARMIWNFDIEPASPTALEPWNPEGNMKNMRAFTTWEKQPLMVKIKRTKRNKKF